MFQKTATLLLILFTISCQKEKKQDPFEITTNRIGYLTHTSQIYQLDSIFSTDSIVKRISGDDFLNNNNEIEIYEKGGDKLLILTPQQELDSTSTISSIQIIDSRYKTTLGLSLASYYKDIKEKYPISKINNTLSSAVLFIDSIQASLTIDKKELPSEYTFNTDIKIEASKIPDSAKIKYFFINWD